MFFIEFLKLEKESFEIKKQKYFIILDNKIFYFFFKYVNIFYMIKKNGFTLIELLVVIAIIGIISTIVYTSIGTDPIYKAKFARISSELVSLDKAFYLAYMDEERNDWWTESELGLGSNPKLSDILAIESGPASGISDYFGTAPSNILEGSEYRYDYDDNEYVGDCEGHGNTQHKGVNLVIHGVGLEDRQKIDMMVDGEDTPKCGKVTYNANDTDGVQRLFFHIAPGDNSN